VELFGLDVVFRHDGYDPAVAAGKDKRGRNLRLLSAAREADPDNPRWLYFLIRDGLPVLDHSQLVELCAALRDLVARDPATGDRNDARHYYRLALCTASRRLAVLGDWPTLLRYCDELDRVDQGDNPDAHYLRSVAELTNGVVTSDDLVRTIRLRRADDVVSTSAIDRSGRHLDALIVSQLSRCRGASEAERYRELCAPWTDMFFDRSVLRHRSGGRVSRRTSRRAGRRSGR